MEYLFHCGNTPRGCGHNFYFHYTKCVFCLRSLPFSRELLKDFTLLCLKRCAQSLFQVTSDLGWGVTGDSVLKGNEIKGWRNSECVTLPTAAWGSLTGVDTEASSSGISSQRSTETGCTLKKAGTGLLEAALKHTAEVCVCVSLPLISLRQTQCLLHCSQILYWSKSTSTTMEKYSITGKIQNPI